MRVLLLDLKKNKIRFNPVYYKGKIVVASDEGDESQILHCIDFATQKLDWKIKAKRLNSELVVYNNVVYYQTFNNELGVVDISTGEDHISEFVPKGKNLSFNLYINYSDDMMYYVCEYYLLALNLKTNTWAWNYQSAHAIGKPIINDTCIYFGTFGGGVYGLDKRIGKQLWHHKINIRTRYSCAIGNDKLFFTSSMGEDKLICLGN